MYNLMALLSSSLSSLAPSPYPLPYPSPPSSPPPSPKPKFTIEKFLLKLSSSSNTESIVNKFIVGIDDNGGLESVTCGRCGVSSNDYQAEIPDDYHAPNPFFWCGHCGDRFILCSRIHQRHKTTGDVCEQYSEDGKTLAISAIRITHCDRVDDECDPGVCDCEEKKQACFGLKKMGNGGIFGYERETDMVDDWRQTKGLETHRLPKPIIAYSSRKDMKYLGECTGCGRACAGYLTCD